MGKGKMITLYRIYGTKVGQAGKGKQMYRTKVAFTTPAQASNYCRYLNQQRNYGGEILFSFMEEKIAVYKKLNDLVKDENEDKILFS